ncbi:hypothetical protein CCR97_15675 [Rhodoplanes elegans]|uniref:Peptidase M15A C-terminal domain-containing protein n=1 Tax=Rhodoplanes elegans TaxID=29408 RepID=A0A327KQ44_9BRAD|nr:hypothetical protein [Rhodoplanes elegans]MBK5959633.1 hypothetical protein [Rhodoplanes elegans]RAI41020.1 hypothetical protein CH338_04450 [Rhodoplanes elegans]
MNTLHRIALVTALVVAVPAVAMARPSKARSPHATHLHAHHGNAHHGHVRRAHRHRDHAHPAGRSWRHARALRAYAYAPALAPNGWTEPTAGFAGGPGSRATARRADGARTPRLGGLVAPLAEKVAAISATCGARVISAVRHTRVAGTGRLSLHASGHAVDMRGNPGCIYGMLQGWSGGYTTDYGRVHHVHISWGGSEHGLRFAHGGGRGHHAHYRQARRAHWASRAGGRRS